MTVWGIDASTRAVSVAMLTAGEEVTVHTTVIDAKGQLRGARRCGIHFEELSPWVRLLNQMRRPELVAVEQPTGAHPKPQSLACWGVLLAVLDLEVGCPVVELTPPMWKAPTVGKGNASKPEIMEWARRSHAYQGSLQDEADAIGVACAGAALLERDARQAA